MNNVLAKVTDGQSLTVNQLAATAGIVDIDAAFFNPQFGIGYRLNRAFGDPETKITPEEGISAVQQIVDETAQNLKQAPGVSATEEMIDRFANMLKKVLSLALSGKPQYQPKELLGTLKSTHPATAAAYAFIAHNETRFEGRDGDTPETAIKMCGITTTAIGIPAELAYLHKTERLPLIGKRVWLDRPDGRILEGFKAQDGTWTWFDITEWYGKE